MKLSVLFVIYFFFHWVPGAHCQLVNKCDKGVFEEKNGIVVFEAESIALSEGWSLENTIQGYSGGGYITWTDPNIIEKNGQGLLSYPFKIINPGIYTLKMRNYHSCEDFTECNDVFVKMDDGDWQKNFNHTLRRWDWNSRQDIDHIFTDSEFFLNEGNHTLYLSGRSQGFSIDKMSLYQKDAYKTAEQSKCVIE